MTSVTLHCPGCGGRMRPLGAGINGDQWYRCEGCADWYVLYSYDPDGKLEIWNYSCMTISEEKDKRIESAEAIICMIAQGEIDEAINHITDYAERWMNKNAPRRPDGGE